MSMAVRDTLDKIETLVADAAHLPLTEKIVISEQDLVHLVEELRQELPLELERADEIMKDKDTIIRTAQEEAAEALEALGYTAAEIESVLRKAPADFSTEQLIKFALKELNRFA